MTNPVSLELQAKIAGWRQKAQEGTLSIEEMKEAIIYLRGDRQRAAESTPAAKRKKAIVAIPHADQMLEELKGMS